jgi:hypothetical protein
MSSNLEMDLVKDILVDIGSTFIVALDHVAMNIDNLTNQVDLVFNACKCIKFIFFIFMLCFVG